MDYIVSLLPKDTIRIPSIIYLPFMWPVRISICWKAIVGLPISLLSLNWIFNVQIRTCLTERNQLKFGETDDNADEN